MAVSAAALVVWAVVDVDTRRQFVTGPGLAKGALIAAIALGVVLTYRGSGVVNFANGALAMYVAYVYAVLRRDGDLFLPPLPNPLALVEGVVNLFRDDGDLLRLWRWPTAVSFGGPMGFWPAAIVSLLFCVLLGLALHLLIFRPLRNAPPLAKVVASIGLLLLLPAIVLRRFTSQPYTVPNLPFFEAGDQVNLPFDVRMSSEQFWIAVLVIIFTVALFVVFQLTRFGLATRAAAENEKGAVVLGFSPEFLAGANWVISTTITGLLGIFVASVQKTVDPATIPALIVPALTAALVGSFTSFGWTTFAGLRPRAAVPAHHVPRRHPRLVPAGRHGAVPRPVRRAAGGRHRRRAVPARPAPADPRGDRHGAAAVLADAAAVGGALRRSAP